MKTLVMIGAVLVLQGMLAPYAYGQSIRFGDNRSDYSRDGECDDRRFVGVGMDVSLDRDDVGHDAADCREAYRNGTITLWDRNKARAMTNCGRISFGDNQSEWANDDSCDDPRFEGPSSADVVLREDIGHDANDCRRLCKAGMVFWRNY